MNTGTGNYHITPDGVFKVYTELGALKVSGIAFPDDVAVNEEYWHNTIEVVNDTVKHCRPLIIKSIKPIKHK